MSIINCKKCDTEVDERLTYKDLCYDCSGTWFCHGCGEEFKKENLQDGLCKDCAEFEKECELGMHGRLESKLLKTIEYFAADHTTSNGWKSPVPYEPTEEEENNYDDAAQWATEWCIDWLPPRVTLEERIDDDRNHDSSSVEYYVAKTSLGKLHIFSYSNNAWSHCDVLTEEDGCESIVDWLKAWQDELPEEWLERYI